MSHRKSLLVAFLLVALSDVSMGADDSQVLTLPSAIQMAKSSSDSLIQLQSAADSAGWQKLKSASDQIPHLSIHGNHLVDEEFQTMTLHLGPEPTEFPLIQ